MDEASQRMLDWIAAQHGRMLEQLIDYASLNTWTFNPAGITALTERINRNTHDIGGERFLQQVWPFEQLDARGHTQSRPLGPVFLISHNPQARRRALLCIHLDTVYPPSPSAQPVQTDAQGRLLGPGVADAKGGLVVMLTAVEAFIRTPFAKDYGLEIVLNPDEEIGSPGSGNILADVAKRCEVGLLYEPAMPDGSLVDRRRGSGNFAIVLHGKAAHTGRDFAAGRSAMLAAAQLTVALHGLNEKLPGVSVNVGSIDGGGPANVVADLAICRVNVRTSEPADEATVRAAMLQMLDAISATGIIAEIQGGFASPPKIPDARGSALLAAAVACGSELGLNLSLRPSGGACDGNRLAAQGLVNIDTLGVRGGEIHSPGEFMIPASLVERAQLSALLLVKLAAGEIPLGG